MFEALPDKGVPAEQILDELRDLRGADLPTHGGRLFAYVYDPALDGLDELARSAHAISAHVNGLDPTAFPSLLAMENALVAAAARLLGGGPAAVGSVTSGGTESLILAVKAARDSRPDLTAPRLLIPSTAHAAFAKAAHYLRVELDVVPVGADLRADPAAMAAAIRPETVLVAASAPSYAHGVVDPIEQLAATAAERGVRFHVDACFGGWILPYLRRLGANLPAFDLSVPGVTSISVDLHKYAYAPKGVSILLHRDEALRLPQYFAYAGWPGYTMINPIISSTRSGGPIAAAVATLRSIGDAGYLELADRTRAAVATLAEAVTATDGIRLYAPPETTVVCLTAANSEAAGLSDPSSRAGASGVGDDGARPVNASGGVGAGGDGVGLGGAGGGARWSDATGGAGAGGVGGDGASGGSNGGGAVDVFVLADELAVRGWHTQPQMAFGAMPATIHLTVTAAVGSTAAQFGPDLADAVAATRARGPVQLPVPLVEAAGALTPEMVTPDLVAGLAEGLGLGGGDFTQMAAVNSLLNVAPPALREALLTGFLSLLQRPTSLPQPPTDPLQPTPSLPQSTPGPLQPTPSPLQSTPGPLQPTPSPLQSPADLQQPMVDPLQTSPGPLQPTADPLQPAADPLRPSAGRPARPSADAEPAAE